VPSPRSLEGAESQGLTETLGLATNFTIRVLVTIDRARIEVMDENVRMPQPRLAPTEAISRRGLAIVDATGFSWGTEGHTEGKSVWLEVAFLATRENGLAQPASAGVWAEANCLNPRLSRATSDVSRGPRRGTRAALLQDAHRTPGNRAIAARFSCAAGFVASERVRVDGC
jgi:hypothetical protein